METSKRVLDVGQCRPDHAAIRRLLESLGADVEQAHLPADALARLRSGHFDLVLVNRKLDQDYSDGIDFVRALMNAPETCTTPVMLISNYEEAQEEAVEMCALHGFGKLQLHDVATLERVKAILYTQSES